MRTAILALVLLVPSALGAQQVRTDPATGDHYVTAYDDEGNAVELRVERVDRVEFGVASSIVSTPAGLMYRYEVTILPTSPQNLDVLVVDCPGEETAVRSLAAFGPLGPDDALGAMYGPWAGRPSCSLLLGALPMEPGQTLTMAVETPFLPAVGEVRAIGSAAAVSWPSSDPIPANDEARTFVHRVQGMTAGWKAVPALVPTRDPALLEDAATGPDLLLDDLDLACGELGWITDPGLCQSLRAKLDAADLALARGDARAARGQLRAFLAELEGQRGPQPGKHIDVTAYWLLRTNVEHLLGRI